MSESVSTCSYYNLAFIAGLYIPIQLSTIYVTFPGGAKSNFVVWIPFMIQIAWGINNSVYNVYYFIPEEDPASIYLYNIAACLDILSKTLLIYYVCLRVIVFMKKMSFWGSLLWQIFIFFLVTFICVTILFAYRIFPSEPELWAIVNILYYVLDGMITVIEMAIILFYVRLKSKISDPLKLMQAVTKLGMNQELMAICVWGLFVCIAPIYLWDYSTWIFWNATANCIKYAAACFVAKEVVRKGNTINFEIAEEDDQGGQDKKATKKATKNSAKLHATKAISNTSEVVVDYKPSIVTMRGLD